MKSISTPAIRVAVVSMTLGLVIMILAIAIISGFKNEVTDRIVGFGSHIQITSVRSANSYESTPVTFTKTFTDSIRNMDNVLHVQRYATIPGAIKMDEDFHVVMLKGIDAEYDWSFIEKNLIEGDVLNLSSDSTTTDVLISKLIADKMHLELGDSFVTYFFQERVRAKKFNIKGIYQTNFSNYDKLFVFSDMQQVSRLNGWENDMASGLEVLVRNYDKLEDTSSDIYYGLAGQQDCLGNAYFVQSIRSMNPAIFDWLDVLDMNTTVILILMLIVSGFAMISALLIIIIERANMIGILKALGSNNTSIRKLFLIISSFLIAKGLLYGNIIALVICFIQKKFGILGLDPNTYYISEVPISLNIWPLLLVNLGTLIVILLVLVAPSYLIAKISPAKTIRFE